MTNQTGLGDRHIGFTEWVKRAYGDRDPEYYDKPKMFMPKVEWLKDDSGDLNMDFVGRFETLEEDFDVVCRRRNFSASLPHLKHSARDHDRQYYDVDAREIVAHRFAEDIERFGYQF